MHVARNTASITMQDFSRSAVKFLFVEHHAKSFLASNKFLEFNGYCVGLVVTLPETQSGELQNDAR